MDNDILDYFIKNTEKQFDKLDSRFNDVEKKIDVLLAFKWRIIGGSVLLSAVLTIALQLAVIIFKART